MAAPNEDEVFRIARAIGDSEARTAYLKQACGDDQEMLHRLTEIIEAAEDSQSFLEVPPPGFEATSPRGIASLSQLIGDRVGPYIIREKIGEGGMGVVYVAEQTEPVQRKVAIKIIKPGMDTKEVIARFEAERQALAFMEHPNIARVLDAGATESGRSYFVMELVRGIPITEYCDQVKATPRERLALFKTVCDAVQHAHQKGIIHRDIKPSNVLVTQVSAKPVVKVIDFGLAKATSGQKLTDKTVYTGFMKLMGTPVYMSPEQAGLSGLDVDTRSDVYSLGILLYELLTGTTPLDKAAMQKQAYEELCRRIREVEAPKPSARISTLKDAERSTIAQQRQVEPKTLRQLLDGDLDIVVLKALEKDRDRRYLTPQDLAADIDRFLSDQPVLAIPPSSLYLFRKYVRRNWGVIATAAVFATLLILASVVSTWQAIRATAFARDAEQAKREVEQTSENLLQESQRRRRELYVSSMQLASQIWSRSDGSQREIEELLAAWIPVDDQPDLREFTWRYQWSLLHENAQHAILGNNSRNAFSQDGDLITVGADGIRVWDKSGKLAAQSFADDASNAELSANGRWGVIATDQVVRLIELATGEVTCEMPGDRFSISSNSQFLACWGSGGEIAVWDIQANPPKSVSPLRPTGFAHLPKQGDLLIATDGKSFLIKGKPTNDYQTEVSAYLDGRSEPVRTSREVPLGGWAWSPDGSFIATGNQLGEVLLQHIERPENVITIGSYGKLITCVAFSPDSKTLVSGGVDGSIEFWNVANALIQFSAGDSAVETVDPNLETLPNSGEPNSQRSGDADKPERRGQAPTTYQKASAVLPTRSIKAHVEPISSISFSPDGSEFSSTDDSGVTKRWGIDDELSIRVRDATDDPYSGSTGILPELTADGVSIGRVLPGYSANGQLRIGDRIIGVAEGAESTFRNNIPDRELFDMVLGGRPGSDVRLEIAREGENAIVKLRRSNKPKWAVQVCRCDFAPDSKSLAVASFLLGATIVNLDTDNATRLPHRCVSVAYSPDERFLAMGDLDRIAIWDISEQQLRGFVKIRNASLSKAELGASLAFSPDGKYLAAGTGWPFLHDARSSDLHVWDVDTLKEIEKPGIDGGMATAPLHRNSHILTAIAFTPDGRSLIAADHHGVVRIWETATWLLEKTLEFPPLTAMDISGDGSLLALGFGTWDDLNPGIILWDLNTGTRRHALLGQRPFAVAFSEDGKTLASTGERHDVLLWDVVTGMPLRKMERHTHTVAGAAFSPDETKLATTDFDGNLQIWEAESLANIDRHPLTLQAIYRRGVTLNRSYRFAEAEATLRHLLAQQQKTLGDDDPVLARTRAELEVAISGQAKMPDRPPPD